MHLIKKQMPNSLIVDIENKSDGSGNGSTYCCVQVTKSKVSWKFASQFKSIIYAICLSGHSPPKQRYRTALKPNYLEINISNMIQSSTTLINLIGVKCQWLKEFEMYTTILLEPFIYIIDTGYLHVLLLYMFEASLNVIENILQ